jgi:predicted nucleic acid-binding protein
MAENRCRGLMLDTVIFNRLLDAQLDASFFGNHAIYATHVQRDELEDTKRKARRDQLLVHFEFIQPESLPTESFILSVSRLDNAKLSSDRLYVSILNALRKKDEPKKAKRPNNQRRDSLIAETAIKNDLLLITDDCKLRAVVREIGGNALSLDEFSDVRNSF